MVDHVDTKRATDIDFLISHETHKNELSLSYTIYLSPLTNKLTDRVELIQYLYCFDRFGKAICFKISLMPYERGMLSLSNRKLKHNWNNCRMIRQLNEAIV